MLIRNIEDKNMSRQLKQQFCSLRNTDVLGSKHWNDKVRRNMKISYKNIFNRNDEENEREYSREQRCKKLATNEKPRGYLTVWPLSAVDHATDRVNLPTSTNTSAITACYYTDNWNKDVSVVFEINSED